MCLCDKRIQQALVLWTLLDHFFDLANFQAKGKIWVNNKTNILPGDFPRPNLLL